MTTAVYNVYAHFIYTVRSFNKISMTLYRKNKVIYFFKYKGVRIPDHNVQ